MSQNQRSGDPKELARITEDSQEKFAEVQEFFNNDLRTPGTRTVNDRTKKWEPPYPCD